MFIIKDQLNKKLLNDIFLPQSTMEEFKLVYKNIKSKEKKKKEMLKEQSLLSVDLDGMAKKNSKLRAKYFLTLGNWILNLYSNPNNDNDIHDNANNRYTCINTATSKGNKIYNEKYILQALELFQISTEYDKKWYKSWHSWAFLNFQIIFNKKKKLLNNNNQNTNIDFQDKSLQNYLINAIKGFFNSISLNSGPNSIQDILRLLTLWFEFNSSQIVRKTILNHFKSVSIDTWLKVIPQIIARINSSAIPFKKTISYILNEVEKIYPDEDLYLNENRIKGNEEQDDDDSDDDGDDNDESLFFKSIIEHNFNNISNDNTDNNNGGGGDDDDDDDDDDDSTSSINSSSSLSSSTSTSFDSDFNTNSESESVSEPESASKLNPNSNSNSNSNSNRKKEQNKKNMNKKNKKLKNISKLLLEKMKRHSPKLVNEAEMVSNELNKIVTLWEELWYAGLEEASEAYFINNDHFGMILILEPLHEMISNVPITMREVSFIQKYGRYLIEAKEFCQKYLKKPDLGLLTQAWNLYSIVFQQIRKQLIYLNSLKLEYISPKLQKINNLELAIPGTYKPGKEIIKIKEFCPIVNVIRSKQKPRKIKIINSTNGKTHKFLLKAHEDIRLDERVNQLFGLINTILNQNPITYRQHIKITKYSVTPLSTDSGLIEWVPHCNTLSELVHNYRKNRNIHPDFEKKIIEDITSNLEQLPTINKIEIFTRSLEQTKGDEIKKVLWLRSLNSESWLERRTNFSTSLALMSMVGYILGLGDRHPRNLMMQKFNAKIIHIDFGDCFEVTRVRSQLPEKIPFRLTRMLINAMEISGIEGTFRHTCENVMKLLRENKDSLMVMLEAFVHDPLIGWKIIDINNNEKQNEMNNEDDEKSKKNTNKNNKVNDQNKNNININININNKQVENKKARQILKRIQDKLTGNDFDQINNLKVKKQVQMLIDEAISIENLSQSYIGWCPFW